jgi:hypothetical protein
MFRFTIYPDGGESYELCAATRDVCSWEKSIRYERTVADLEGTAMADLYGIAFHAAVRQGKYSGKRAEFDRTHDLNVEDDTEPDPTRQEATATE